MTLNPGRDYLEAIRNELASGHRQHRMGENLLRAFGYMRRRTTALEEINATLNELGLVTDPPVDAQMPLRVPHIIFDLAGTNEITPTGITEDSETGNLGYEDADSPDSEIDDSLPEPTFRISELGSANTEVERVAQGDSILLAFTKMALNNYSQLVVASHARARQQDIKGIVSFQSIAHALMNGTPATAPVSSGCIEEVPIVNGYDDLISIIPRLSESEVVLVVGRDKRLQGIVTAWDLAEEFAVLVEPFKRIGEIEQRLRALIERKLSKEIIFDFLKDSSHAYGDLPKESHDLTLGEVQRVLESPKHWAMLALPYDQAIFMCELNRIRDYRNQLMHFKDLEDEIDTPSIANFCNLVRAIRM